jgi:two-component system, cell cycle sensor histidine kinase and response regulator CckA
MGHEMAIRKKTSGNNTELRGKVEENAKEKAAAVPEDLEAMSPVELRKKLRELLSLNAELEIENRKLRMANEEPGPASSQKDLKEAHGPEHISTEEKLQIKNRMLTSIKDYIQTIMSAEPDHLYKTIVTKLKEITGTEEVFINDYDSEHSDLVFRQSTLSEENNTWLMKKLGNRLTNFRSPVSKEQYEIIMNEPVGRIGSLREITFGAISESIGMIIEKMFGFGWFVALVLKHENKLLGTLMIAGKKGQIQPDNEELLAYASATANVLSRRMAEVAMNESEARYRLLSEHTTDTVWLVDMDLNMTYHSPSGEKLRGFTVQEIMDMPLEQQFTPESLRLLSDLIFSELPRVLADQDYNPLFTLDLEYTCKDGSTVWSESKFSIIRDESGKPVAILGEGRDVTERKKTEEALKESERRLLEAQRIAHVGNWEWNFRTGEVLWSPETYNMHGLIQNSPTLTPDILTKCVHPDDLERFKTVISQAVSEGIPANLDYRIVHTDGSIRVIHAVGSVTEFDAEGRPLMMLGTDQDITERKRTEDERQRLQSQFLQAQKMESVGKLAGGVAHDFNNMLSVIIGHADMLMSHLQPSDPAYRDLNEIMLAGERSAELTKQLLAFARKQVIAPVVLDLNDSVSAILKMLGRLIGENIRLSWKPAVNLWPVKMDPSQISQILANLVVNSRDAISDSGNITIETFNLEVNEANMVLYPELPRGKYILLEVSDDGCGMDDDIRSQIFEPFYTTKELGKGTGLGLSTVYGIVKQNSGFINVDSEPGKGTTFMIYLPACESEGPEDKKSEDADAPKGTETVLLVEDEEAVLGIYRIMLEKLGYKVLPAGNPADAIELSRNYKDDIHLLLTDVLMPEFSGSFLWNRLSDERPEMKCLYMSGYTFDIISRQGILEEGVNYLQKPFSTDTLARKIREVLGS